jgi:hypothetical protein
MTMIDTSDARFQKAVAIADGAGQWLKCRSIDGRKAYGVPSQRCAGHYYLTTLSSCTCFDAQRHICKHIAAVAIHCARVAGKPMPARDVLDGLEQMVVDRHPVLDMVRHPDGEITWERHNHANGETTYLPRHEQPRPVADASTYDRIFSKFVGD